MKRLHLPLLPRYMPTHLRREVKELFWSVGILNFAVALILVFEPIYLYQLGYSLQQIFLFYIGVYGIYFFILPLGAKIVNRIGYERAIFYSSFFLIGYYVVFWLADFSPWLLFIAPIVFAIQKSLYWPAYHADFAQFTHSNQSAKEVSMVNALVTGVAIAGPFIGGLILHFFGYAVLFVMVSILIFVSNYPLLKTREDFKPQPFSYLYTYKRLFAKQNRQRFFAYLGFGEELIAMIAWPIFVTVVVVDLLSVGSVFAISSLLTAFVALYVGKLADKHDKERIIRFGAALFSFSWFFRIFSFTGLHVFLSEFYYKVVRNFIMVPLVSLTYNHAKNHTIMNTVVFFELSLVVGKLFTAFVFYILWFFVPEWWLLFAATGVISLLYGFMKK